MGYHLFKYALGFLPLVLLIYQIVPRKFRFVVMLIADYTFFCLISKGLIVYLLAATGCTYGFSRWMEHIDGLDLGSNKLKTKKKRKILLLAIILQLGILLVLKYFNFFAGGIAGLFKASYRPIKFLIPIGISYYTLQIISYLTDVCRGTQKPEHNIAKIALYLSFFPQIMEGPISRYHEIAEDLYAGKSLEYRNVSRGYQRILWGLAKKYLVADRVAAVVGVVFNDYASYDGSIVLCGVLLYTCQLYMEFSGCIDIVIGSAECFGVTLPENFKQPFLAKDASDFWHRWHITLGTWFKDYIFYPVSLSKKVKNLGKAVKQKCGKNVAKFVAPLIALFCVWISNGLWHGPKTTYVFYGLYYFVLIFMGNVIEEPVAKLCGKLHINREGVPYRVFRFVKLFIIVNIGELFFRADTVGIGFEMLGRIFSKFHISVFIDQFRYLGMDLFDWGVAIIGIILVCVVGAFREKDVDVRGAIGKWVLPARWIVWYALIILVVILGAYGAGYTQVAMIYAGY